MAGRKCTICSHPKRNEIDKSLAVDGAVLRAIAVQFRVSKDSLKRHMDNGHIAEKIQKATHVQEIKEADDLLSQIMNAKNEIREIRKEARNRTFKPKEGEPINDPDNELALKTFDKEAKFLEMEGKVIGAFKGDKPSGAITLRFDKEDKDL
jgi:hypothetical protein